MPVSSPALAASHPCLGATEDDKEGMLGEAQVSAIGPVTSYIESLCTPPARSVGMSREASTGALCYHFGFPQAIFTEAARCELSEC